MKYFLAVFLFILQGEIFLFHKAVDANNDDVLQKRVDAIDLLSNASCWYLKNHGYCRYSFIQNKLCYTLCHCNDTISQRSCSIIRTKNKCNIAWSAYFCKLTCNHCSSYNLSCKTNNPLGMKSNAIPDSSITASSIYGKSYSPAKARLDTRNGGWAARTNSINEWLKVDLGQVTKVTHIATQGLSSGSEWVKSYSIQYSLLGQHFLDYKGGKIFTGNTDKNTIVKHSLNPPIIARYIRVRPKTWHSHISMRMELYGCR